MTNEKDGPGLTPDKARTPEEGLSKLASDVQKKLKYPGKSVFVICIFIETL